MSKQLGIRVKMRGVTSGLPQPRHPISFASYRKRIFCKQCNTHFKALEDETIPLLVPVAQGKVVSLGEPSKLILSQWAAKTGMALLAMKGLVDVIPQPHRDAVRNSGHPPESSWVGYFPWSGHPNIWGADNEMSTNGPNPAVRGQSYSVIFTFAKIGFMFAGFCDPIPAGFEIGSGTYPIHQFWPTRPALLHWPPNEPPAELSDMSNIVRFAPLVPKG
jgi:hypothetical protein